MRDRSFKDVDIELRETILIKAYLGLRHIVISVKKFGPFVTDG